MRCHWVNDKEIGRWHYPGCMGAAVYGPSGCTCGPAQRKKAVEQKLIELEERVRRLEARTTSEQLGSHK